MTKSSDIPHDTQALSTFAEAVSTARDRIDVFLAAENTTRTLIGHSLFTIMLFDADAMEVQRCYTSDPENYPTGGRKKKRDTDWGRHVLLEGHVFIGANETDIRRNFDDYDVILELGLCAVLNIPIKRLGQTIGTMNLLDTTAHYGVNDVAIGSVITMGLAVALA